MTLPALKRRELASIRQDIDAEWTLESTRMRIPRHWRKAEGKVVTHDGSQYPATAWGWGVDADEAEQRAEERLANVIRRMSEDDFHQRESYLYADRPLREEILETIPDGETTEPFAMLTRNGYGAQILNTSQLLFLDIDLRPPTTWQRIARLFRAQADSLEHRVELLKEQLQQFVPSTSFRIYRTAEGLRVLATDRKFDPGSDEVMRLMEGTGTDPAYKQLCRIQECFRARLTPKPWRCRMAQPPGSFPRSAEDESLFQKWLQDYQRKSEPFATCQFMTSVGSSQPLAEFRELVMLHDELTHATQPRPLA